ncbi:MAG: hypothetical protein ACRDBG_23570 [Waterburya sp.]
MQAHPHLLPQRDDLIVFPEHTTRSDVITFLSRSVGGISGTSATPNIIYRSDLLPRWEEGVYLEDFEVAAVQVEFDQGFPTIHGEPIWNKWIHEPAQYFQIFAAYLKQPEEHGARQIHLLVDKFNFSIAKLRAMAKEFYWVARSRAFDMFEEATHQKTRAIRVRSTEVAHLEASTKIFNSLVSRLTAVDDDGKLAIDSLNASEAIKALDTVVKIQRLALGLSSTNATASPSASPAMAFEAVMRTITKSSGDSGAVQGNQTDDLQQMLAENPNLLVSAQEIILRMNSEGLKKLQSGKVEEDVTY